MIFKDHGLDTLLLFLLFLGIDLFYFLNLSILAVFKIIRGACDLDNPQLYEPLIFSVYRCFFLFNDIFWIILL